MKIRILATSDIHGSMFPFSYSDKKEKDFGFLKLQATMKQYEEGNYLKIDNGDILEGTPFLDCYYHFDGKTPHPMALAVKQAKYNYLNLGNHDLNYGPKALFNYLNNSTIPCLTGNLKYKNKIIGQEYTLHRFDDQHQIAIIGVITHYITNWEKKENLLDFEVEDAFSFVKRVVKKIKEKENVQGIVVVYHGGFERDLESDELIQADTGENQASLMCKEIKGIDLMISGHQHRSLAGKVNGVHYTQTANLASEFAVIDWDLDKKEISQKLVPATKNYSKEDALPFINLEEKTQKWLDQELAEVVGVDLEVKDEFLARLHKHPIITLINTIQKEAMGTNLSGNALFNGAIGFHRHITMRDVLATYVYPNTLVSFEVDGKFIKAYLEKSASYFTYRDGKIGVSKEFGWPKPQHYNYDMVDGISYTINVACECGKRISELSYEGKPVKDDDIFTLTVSNYRASGGGDYLMFKKAKVIKEDTRNMANLIVAYLAKHPKLAINHQENIKVIYQKK